jgi:hypothetical protein
MRPPDQDKEMASRAPVGADRDQVSPPPPSSPLSRSFGRFTPPGRFQLDPLPWASPLFCLVVLLLDRFCYCEVGLSLRVGWSWIEEDSSHTRV